MPRPSSRNRIEEAAIEVFAEEGFAGATTRGIADRAGVAEGTIFRHFPTKRKLFLAVLLPFAKNVVAPTMTASLVRVLNRDHPTLRGFLDALVDDRMAMIERHQSWFKMLAQEALLQPELRGVLETQLQEVALPHFANACRRLQEAGEMAALPPDQVLRLLFTTVGGYALLRYVVAAEFPWDDPRDRKITLDFLEKGLRP